jgi:hypothetical protein
VRVQVVGAGVVVDASTGTCRGPAVFPPRCAQICRCERSHGPAQRYSLRIRCARAVRFASRASGSSQQRSALHRCWLLWRDFLVHSAQVAFQPDISIRRPKYIRLIPTQLTKSFAPTRVNAGARRVDRGLASQQAMQGRHTSKDLDDAAYVLRYVSCGTSVPRACRRAGLRVCGGAKAAAHAAQAPYIACAARLLFLAR